MKMRKLLFAVMTIAMVVLFNACSDEDKCKNVTCKNGGTCLDGTCSCAAGYEGTLCDSVSRNKFLFANYNVTETCSEDSCGTNKAVNTPQYASSITAGATIDTVKIDHFGNYSAVIVKAGVNGSDLTIPSQTFLGDTFQGTGNINQARTQITLHYTTTDGCDVITCAATYVK